VHSGLGHVLLSALADGTSATVLPARRLPRLSFRRQHQG
jgi:hypothetical protein